MEAVQFKTRQNCFLIVTTLKYVAGWSWVARRTTWMRCAAKPPPSSPASTSCW